MNIAESKSVVEHDQYEIVRGILFEMKTQNLLANGAGFCWGLCDLLYQRLQQAGIKSRLVECELVATCSDPPQFVTVGGHASPQQPNQVASHVVVITDHPSQPLLIDCSISHILPDPFNVVCGIVSDDSDSLGRYYRLNWNLTYRAQVGNQFPALHQANIIDRIRLDNQLRHAAHQNRVLIMTVFALLAMLAGVIAWNRSIIEENRIRINLLDQRIDHFKNQIK